MAGAGGEPSQKLPLGFSTSKSGSFFPEDVSFAVSIGHKDRIPYGFLSFSPYVDEDPDSGFRRNLCRLTGVREDTGAYATRLPMSLDVRGHDEENPLEDFSFELCSNNHSLGMVGTEHYIGSIYRNNSDEGYHIFAKDGCDLVVCIRTDMMVHPDELVFEDEEPSEKHDSDEDSDEDSDKDTDAGES